MKAKSSSPLSSVIPNKPPPLKDYPPDYMMPLPPERTEMDKDELQPVKDAFPLPDLLPRSVEEIKLLRELQKMNELVRRHVPAKRELPHPYVNDDECDEFEDKTIDTEIENLSENEQLRYNLPDSFTHHHYYYDHTAHKAKAKSSTTAVTTVNTSSSSDGGSNSNNKDKETFEFTFHLGGPSVSGDVSAVFENGMLYKIITHSGDWYYYNDMDKYEMHVTFTFGAQSDVEPSERAEVFVTANNEITASLIIYPGETVKLLSGKVNGFKCSAKAVPLNDSKREILYGEVNDKIATEIEELANKMHLSQDALNEENVLEYCLQHQSKFIDCAFRPCDYSLYRPLCDTYMPRFIP